MGETAIGVAVFGISSTRKIVITEMTLSTLNCLHVSPDM